jgi:hypothetical protein
MEKQTKPVTCIVSCILHEFFRLAIRIINTSTHTTPNNMSNDAFEINVLKSCRAEVAVWSVRGTASVGYEVTPSF